MSDVHVDLRQVGRWSYTLVVSRDGWIIDERPLRGPRRWAKRTMRHVFDDMRHAVHNEHVLSQAEHEAATTSLADSVTETGARPG